MKSSILLAVLAMTVPARAVISGFNNLVVDFTQPAAAITNATWSHGPLIAITTNGLVCGSPTNGLCGVWVQSLPVAIGVQWRPAGGANVSIDLNLQPGPPGALVGDFAQPYGELVFVRFSPDKKHWSDWQALEGPTINRATLTNCTFHGLVAVEQSERQRYGQFVSEYSSLDVPWKSDEEAAVKWILQREPDFFEKQLPFVGYVQFKYEASLPGGWSIKGVKMKLYWAVGGLHSFPKDPDAEKGRDGPWRFEAK